MGCGATTARTTAFKSLSTLTKSEINEPKHECHLSQGEQSSRNDLNNDSIGAVFGVKGQPGICGNLTESEDPQSNNIVDHNASAGSVQGVQVHQLDDSILESRKPTVRKEPDINGLDNATNLSVDQTSRTLSNTFENNEGKVEQCTDFESTKPNFANMMSLDAQVLSPEVLDHRNKVKEKFDTLANIEVTKDNLQKMFFAVDDLRALYREAREIEKISATKKGFIELAYYDYIVELNWVGIYLEVFKKLHELSPDSFDGPTPANEVRM